MKNTNGQKLIVDQPISRQELFAYQGSYEDFTEGSDRYYAQWAVDHNGSAVRDNTVEDLISIGKELQSLTQM